MSHPRWNHHFSTTDAFKMFPHNKSQPLQYTGLLQSKHDAYRKFDRTRISTFNHDDLLPYVLQKELSPQFLTSMVKSFFSYFYSTLPDGLLSYDNKQILHLFTHLSMLFKTIHKNTSCKKSESASTTDVLLAFYTICNNTPLPEDLSNFIESFRRNPNWLADKKFTPAMSDGVLLWCIDELYHRYKFNFIEFKRDLTNISELFEDKKIATRSINIRMDSHVKTFLVEGSTKSVNMYSDDHFFRRCRIAAWKLQEDEDLYNKLLPLIMLNRAKSIWIKPTEVLRKEISLHA